MLTKYIKNVLCGVAICLSYILDAWCLKVKHFNKLLLACNDTNTEVELSCSCCSCNSLTSLLLNELLKFNNLCSCPWNTHSHICSVCSLICMYCVLYLSGVEQIPNYNCTSSQVVWAPLHLQQLQWMHFLEQQLLHQALHTHTWWALQEDRALFHGYPVMNLLMKNHIRSNTTLQIFTTASVKHFTLTSFGEDADVCCLSLLTWPSLDIGWQSENM